MFGKVLNPPLMAIDQNIFQQNTYIRSIQNKGLSYFRQFRKRQGRFFLSYADFATIRRNYSIITYCLCKLQQY